MKKLLIFVFMIAVLHAASGQWEKIHPSTDFQRSFSYAFTIPATGKYYAIGADLAISSDSGETWSKASSFNTPVPISQEAQYEDLYFVDEQIGVLVYNNKIFLTTNKGTSWEEKVSLQPNHPNYSNSSYFTSVYFRNQQHGIAVGTFKKIYETTDGGQTWNMKTWSSQTAPYMSYTDVFFLNDTVGFICGYEVSNILMNFGFTQFVLKTIDGGATWTRSDIPTQFDYKSIRIQATHPDTVFVRLSRTQSVEETYRSADGGITWVKNSPPLRSIKTIRWIDGKTGVVFGKDHSNLNRFYRTEDGGISWENIQLPFDPDLDENSVSDISFVDKVNGFASGSGGMLMISKDKGKTWTIKNTFFPQLIAIDFSSPHIGYASRGKGFYKTTDGGITWNYKENSDSLFIWSIDFTNEDNGLFYGFRNYNYYVSNGGQLIDSIALPLIFRYNTEFISRGDSLFVTGATLNPSRLNFFRSGNKGSTWEIVPIEEGLVSAVSLHEAGNGVFYIGTSQDFRKSSDGGLSWQQIFTFQSDYLSESCYLGKDTLLALMTSGKIMRSVDGAKNWTTVLDLPGDYPGNFKKINSRYVYLYGGIKEGEYIKSAIWKSEDAGENWTPEVLPSELDMVIRDMSIGGTSVFATTGYGQVLRYELPPDVITGIQSSTKKDLLLYPVPSDNLLYVRFSENTIPIEIQAISITGQINSLKFKKVENIITIDISALSSGLYFLKLNAENVYYNKSFVKR